MFPLNSTCFLVECSWVSCFSRTETFEKGGEAREKLNPQRGPCTPPTLRSPSQISHSCPRHLSIPPRNIPIKCFYYNTSHVSLSRWFYQSFSWSRSSWSWPYPWDSRWSRKLHGQGNANYWRKRLEWKSVYRRNWRVRFILRSFVIWGKPGEFLFLFASISSRVGQLLAINKKPKSFRMQIHLNWNDFQAVIFSVKFAGSHTLLITRIRVLISDKSTLTINSENYLLPIPNP